MKRIRLLESGAWALGLGLLALYLVARVHGAVASQTDLERFEQARVEGRVPANTGTATGASAIDPEPEIDFSLWAKGRVEAYHESLQEEIDLPLAVLRIPGIDLEVPIHSGTDELVLNRGVGWIAGTTRPDVSGPAAGGNVGIAGHRDGFFRGLKDVGPGDVIEMETLVGTRTYVIDGVMIVKPEDVWVLNPTSEPSLTLVTCYPFYHVGKAPKRYIVKAVLGAPQSAARSVNQPG